MKTNSESSHFHQSNLPIAHSLLLLLGRRLSPQQSNSSTFPAFAHSISKAKWRGDSDIQERVVHKMSPSRESEKHASVEESLKRARHKYHSENLNRTMINPPLFSFFFKLDAGSVLPQVVQSYQKKKQEIKKLFFLCCFQVWKVDAYLPVVRTGSLSELTYRSKYRLPPIS